MKLLYVMRVLIMPFIFQFILYGCGKLNEVKQLPITTTSVEAEKLFELGRDALDNIRFDHARRLFTKAIEWDSSFAQAYLYRSLIAETNKGRQQDLEKAITNSYFASDGETMFINAEKAFYLENDKVKWAEKMRDLVKMYPDDKRMYYEFSRVKFYFQEYDDAIKVCRKGITLDPEFAPLYNNLGYAYLNRKEYDQAEEVFQKYIRLVPDRPNPYDSMGDLLTKTGRFEEANQYYQEAINMDPGFTISLRKMGINMVFLGRATDGRGKIMLAIESTSSPGEKVQCLETLVRSYLYLGNFSEALNHIDKVISAATSYGIQQRIVYNHLLKGCLYSENGDYIKAEECLKNCKNLLQRSSMIPSVYEEYNYRLHWNQGICAARKGSYSRAITFAEELRRQINEANNQEMLKDYYYPLIGFIHLRQENYTQALKYFKKANQENPWVLYNMARAELQSGNIDTASILYQKAAKWNEDSLEYALVRYKAQNIADIGISTTGGE